MPSGYYLRIAALLVGYGVNRFPRVSPRLALAAIVGTSAARPIVRTADYREMLGRFHAECSHCSVVVGTGYVGAVAACVL